MRGAVLLPLLLLVPFSAGAVAGEATAVRLAGDLDLPVDLAFDAKGALWFAEVNSGDVRQVLGGGKVSAPVLHVAASPGGNGGFTGLAADPDRAGAFYAVYSFDKPEAVHGKVNRVVRIEDGKETVLLDDLPWFTDHDGGRVAVGPDGYLYVTTGDNAPADRAVGDARDKRSQEIDRLEGKVLRLALDGSPAPDNMEGANPYVYAIGFRNPFGLAFMADGTPVVAENGAEEEVNIIVRGGNYGWPYCAGDCDREGMIDPVAWWPAGSGTTGMAIVDDVAYVGEFNHGWVRTADLHTGETGSFWNAPSSGVLDVEAGPDGCFYVATLTAIHQVRPEGNGPCIAFTDAADEPVGAPTPDGGGDDPAPDPDEAQGPEKETVDETVGRVRVPAAGAIALLGVVAVVAAARRR